MRRPGYRCEAATEKEILTGFGKLKYRRRLFRNYLKQSLHLVDERLGLVDGFFTPGAARRLLLLHSRMPVRESVETAAALGPMRCAESRLLKLAGRFGREWDRVREAALARIRESEPVLGGVEQIMVQLDGVTIRRIEEKQGDGGAEAQWREAANGVVCLQDGKGRCLKTSYFSFMPEALKPRLKRDLAAEVRAAQERYPGARLVAVADGAPELWTSVLYCSLFSLRSAILRLARRNIMNLQRFLQAAWLRLPAPGSGLTSRQREFRAFGDVLRPESRCAGPSCASSGPLELPGFVYLFQSRPVAVPGSAGCADSRSIPPVFRKPEAAGPELTM